MTKITIRDRIWDAALTIAEEKQDRSTWGRRFKPADVANRMDDPPSRRTVRETMAAMAEFGRLKKGRSKGQYEPPPEPDEDEEESSSKDRNKFSGPKAHHVVGGPQLAQQMREEQREADRQEAVEDVSNTIDYVNSHTGVDEDRNKSSGDVDEDALEAEDIDADELLAELEAGDPEPCEVRQEAAQSYVADLDLPGDGQTLEARKQAVRACYDYLRREGAASKQDFINDVRPDHPASYGSAGGWWNTIGKKGLRELARARDDIEAPVEGGQTWHHTP